MAIALSRLPFLKDDLEPKISQKTLDFHYDKHHQGYVDKLNLAIVDTLFDKLDLEEIVQKTYKSYPGIFNNAAQIWNHDFYWKCLLPVDYQKEPSAEVVEKISQQFGSPFKMKSLFNEAGRNLFGSGWTWLVRNPDGNLAIKNYRGADTPIVHNCIPILVCDMWEHAYYLDYQNSRDSYLQAFWSIINWNFVELNMRLKPISPLRSLDNQEETRLTF